jgi:outer membrane protein assembly factor BamB
VTFTRIAIAFVAASVLVPMIPAQRGGPDWTTAAGDPQRTSWVRFDPQVTAAKIVKPGAFKFLWKVSMDTTGGRASEPIEISTYIGYRGFKALTVVAGPDSIYTVDYDLGVPFWSQHYGTATKITGCAMRPAAIGKSSSLTPIPPRTVRPSAGYHTVTGKPHEGIPLSEAMGGQLGAGAAPRVAAPAQALPPGIRFSVPIFLVTSDGMAHAITFDSGKEGFKPVPFLPPGSSPSDLIVVQNTLYAATMPGCGSGPNSVYALDVATSDMKAEGIWKAPAGNVLGAPAFNKAGTLFVATDKALFGLKPGTLEQTLMDEAPFASTPIVITGKSKEWIAAGTKDGKIILMDGRGAVTSSDAGFTPTALATADDASGVHWIFATDITKGRSALHAYKLVESAATPNLQEVWKSADMASPGRPLIVDGVVFALATGADRSGGIAEVPTRGTHATVYALDAATGKPLWDSGSTMTSFVGTGSMAFNESELFVPTFDNTLYTFGHPEPHQ